VNPEALSSPALSHRSVYSEFDTVAALAETLTHLKSEHEMLTQQLTLILCGPDQTRFTQFKSAEVEFGARLLKREAEVEAFGKVLSRYRVNVRPTFVEVDASIVRRTHRPEYDLINASLLVSNEQRPFFTKTDIERQNAELRSLIDDQEESLRLLTARLKLFNSLQNATSARFAVTSLQRGCPPSSLASETPTVEAELHTKLRVLTGELAQLIAERKRLTAKRIAEKLSARKRRPVAEPIAPKEGTFRRLRERVTASEVQGPADAKETVENVSRAEAVEVKKVIATDSKDEAKREEEVAAESAEKVEVELSKEDADGGETQEEADETKEEGGDDSPHTGDA
jgi:hypothetical protein